MKKYILGIDTSCDDTGISILEFNERRYKIKSNIVLSQIKKHSKYKGIVPEIAAREHVKAINSVIKIAVNQANIELKDVDYIGVTNAPGLVGSLVIGLAAAKSISYVHNIPLYAVNHLEAHLYSIFLEQKIAYPFHCLLISGGHTVLARVEDDLHYEIIGKSLDDAAGEAYDKAAKILNLGYPGGPVIERLSLKVKNKKLYKLTPPMWKHKSNNFSFSGLKTGLMNLVNKHSDIKKIEIAYAFQKALFLSIYDRIIRADEKGKINKLILSGGVAANRSLVKFLKQRLENKNIEVLAPKIKYCTDNGAMVAVRTYFLIKNNIKESDLNLNSFNAIEKFSMKKQKNKKM